MQIAVHLSRNIFLHLRPCCGTNSSAKSMLCCWFLSTGLETFCEINLWKTDSHIFLMNMKPPPAIWIVSSVILEASISWFFFSLFRWRRDWIHETLSNLMLELKHLVWNMMVWGLLRIRVAVSGSTFSFSVPLLFYFLWVSPLSSYVFC